MDWVLELLLLVKLLDMLEPLEVSCEGGHGLTTEVTFYDLAEGWGFCTGGDSLTPVLFQHEEAVMHHVPDDTGLEAGGDALPHTKHFKAAYWLTGYQGHGSIIFGLRRVDGEHPRTIQWAVPIERLYEGVGIEILNDGSFKFVGRPDGVVNP